MIKSVSLMTEVRSKIQDKSANPAVISGCLGPRGDGYKVGMTQMTSQEAEDYHSKHIGIFASKTEADLVSAFTLNYPGQL